MIDGARRHENPRGQRLRARIGELWDTGRHSTYEIAALCHLDEADVCRILRELEGVGCVS